MGRLRGSANFVGRSSELSAFRAAWASATAGQPCWVLVGGEAGVGKTRLVTEFTNEVSADGARVVVGSCPPVAMGLSVDSAGDHTAWAKDIEETQGYAPNYPIISDADFHVSKLYGMLPAGTAGDPGRRTPADNQTVRNVFVTGPDKKVKLILVYPMTTGRNFEEVLRVIDSLQLTAKHKVSTPVNWKQGEDVIIAGPVSDEEAWQRYPEGWKSPRPYIRIVPQPQ